MCWQDVRIWRSERSVWSTVAIGAGATQILPANPQRVAIVLGVSNGGAVCCLNDPAVVFGRGVFKGIDTAPIVLHIKQYGSAITDAWYAIPNGTFPNLSLAEVFLTRKESELVNE